MPDISVGAGVPDRPKPIRIANVDTNGKMSVPTVGAGLAPPGGIGRSLKSNVRRNRSFLRNRRTFFAILTFHRAGGASPSPTDRRRHFRTPVHPYRIAALRAADSRPYGQAVTIVDPVGHVARCGVMGRQLQQHGRHPPQHESGRRSPQNPGRRRDPGPSDSAGVDRLRARR